MKVFLLMGQSNVAGVLWHQGEADTHADDVHFTRAALAIMGMRYANAILDLERDRKRRARSGGTVGPFRHHGDHPALQLCPGPFERAVRRQ